MIITTKQIEYFRLLALLWVEVRNDLRYRGLDLTNDEWDSHFQRHTGIKVHRNIGGGYEGYEFESEEHLIMTMMKYP